MIRHLIAASLVLAGPVLASETKAVTTSTVDSAGAMATANAIMTAIGTKDETTLKTLILPQALLLSQRVSADGTNKSAVRTRDEWLAGLLTVKGALSEQMTNPQMMIHRDLAHVWAPYTFDIDGKRSHCGIDSLGLARIDGQWRVTSMTWTAETNGCPK